MWDAIQLDSPDALSSVQWHPYQPWIMATAGSRSGIVLAAEDSNADDSSADEVDRSHGGGAPGSVTGERNEEALPGIASHPHLRVWSFETKNVTPS